MNMHEYERREEIRFPLSLRAKVAYRLEDGAIQRDDVCTRDVSSKGGFFYLETPPYEGTRLSIHLSLDCHSGESIIQLNGFVLRRSENGMAVRFERNFKIYRHS